ncbi:hypothetical protein FO519_001215 [Halicephalobus sp. NKZ332]|nr:hypothetical protein FO519_001215 [Halicephalobus sp. NKZ332]
MLILISLILLSIPNFASSACPNGTHAVPSTLGTSYKCAGVSQITYDFMYGEYECASQNGHLISIANKDVNTFIAGILKQTDLSLTGGVWVGVSNMLDSVWKNVDDGSNATFFNWAPDALQGGTYPLCVYINNDGVWYSNYCYVGYYYLCGLPESG